MMFEAYVTNLGMYPEYGVEVGEYLKFPTTAEEVRALFSRIGIDGIRYQEYFITNYESDVLGLYDHLGEYESLDELNYLAHLLEEMTPDELEKLEAVMDAGEYTSSVKNLINLTQNLDCFEFYTGVKDEEDLGRMYLLEVDALQIPEYLVDYIDYEAYGRDIRINEGGHFAPGGYVFAKKLILVIMLCVFQMGVSLLLFPIWNRLFTEREVMHSAERFLSEAAAPVSEPETESTDPTEPQKPYAELWEEMCAYNDNLYAQKQADLNSTDDFKESGFRLRDYGRKDEVFAVLTIPKINLDMPVYLGATDLNLASGAAHLSQTSLPIGGENTNCVIAGHRGWNGALYFRYVPDLVRGDTVTLQNIWETLTYQVVETKIIAPNDVDAIRIQEGRELLTLLTCHPYASGGKQRYLVICERVYQEDNYGETHGG